MLMMSPVSSAKRVVGNVTTGAPSASYPLYQQLGGERALFVERLGLEGKDPEILDAGNAVVGIVFPHSGNKLVMPMVIISMRAKTTQDILRARRVSTAWITLDWQEGGRMMSTELWTPASVGVLNFAHLETTEDNDGAPVFRFWAGLSTTEPDGRGLPKPFAQPSQRFVRLTNVSIRFGAAPAPEVPVDFVANSGAGLRTVRYTISREQMPE